METQIRKPVISIIYGEASGIGPEILLKALAEKDVIDFCRPIIVGDMRVMREAKKAFGSDLDLRSVNNPEEASWEGGQIPVLDQKNLSMDDFTFGYPNASTGRAMIEDTKAAVQLVLDGFAQGAVGGPHSKIAAEDAGFHFEGYPGLIAEMTDHKYPFLLLVSDKLRVANVTLHVSLRRALDLLNKDLVFECIKATDEAVRSLGITHPKIAVAGLNPHAGENRLFGDEDEDEIKPAVTKAKSLGIDAVGPLPADSLFYGCQDGPYDAYVAMYHDQAHLPVKVLAFKRAAAVAIGVPVNWATVDHGCALDIAWKGTADHNVIAYVIQFVSKRAAVNL